MILYKDNNMYTYIYLYLNDHYDIIKWKQFQRYWPFVKGIHSSPVTGGFPSQKASNTGHWCSFVVSPNKLLNKHLIDW